MTVNDGMKGTTSPNSKTLMRNIFLFRLIEFCLYLINANTRIYTLVYIFYLLMPSLVKDNDQIDLPYGLCYARKQIW